jgi:hypothetical protein
VCFLVGRARKDSAPTSLDARELTPLGKPISGASSKLDVRSLFVAPGRGSKSSRPKTVTIESLVRDSVRTGVEAIPLPSRGVIVCGCASAPFTDLIAYSNHLYGEHHKAFEVAIAEQEASFQPRECVFCDLSLRSKTAWVEHVSTPRHVGNEQYAKALLKLTCTTNVCTELEHPLRSKGKRSFEEACAEVVAESKRIKSNPLVRFTSTSINLTETEPDRGADKPSDKPAEKPVDASESRE